MPDRPRSPGNHNGPDDPSSEWGWAYGRGQGAPASRPPQDNGETAVRRTVPRGQGYPPQAPARPGYDRPMPAPGQIQPTPGEYGYGRQQGQWSQPSEYGGGGGWGGRDGGGYGGGGGGRGGRPRPKRSSAGKKIFTTILVILAILIASVAWIGISAWNKIDKVAYEPDGDRPDDQPGTTYLIVGSDSRAGLTKEEGKKLGTGSAADVSGARTDTIKLLHTGSGKSIVVTLPRDSIVPIPGHGTSKINAAFAYGGPTLLTQTIEQDTGVKIDGYVEIGMGGVARLVDGVGGVTICPDQDMKDPLAGLDVKKGCQEADGVTALAYSRSRHAMAKTGDLGRGAHQTEVISSIGKKAASPSTLLNPFKLAKMSKGAEGLKVGKGMSIFGGIKFLLAFRALASGSAMTCGVPISDFAVHWDRDRALEMFGHIKDDTIDDIPDDLCTPTGLKGVKGID